MGTCRAWYRAHYTSDSPHARQVSTRRAGDFRVRSRVLNSLLSLSGKGNCSKCEILTYALISVRQFLGVKFLRVKFLVVNCKRNADLYPNTTKKSKTDSTVGNCIHILKSNISKGTTFLLRVLTKNDSKGRRCYKLK